MNIMRYEPWGLVNQLQNEVNRMFEGRRGYWPDDDASVVTMDWVPSVDIKEEDNQFVLHADIPGVDPKDIEVTMEGGALTIRGERKSETRENREGYHRVERVSGQFYRRFSLPDTANPEKIHATGKNGVLEITIAKHEKVQPRRIKIDG